VIWTRMVATALIAAAGVALVWLGLGLCRVTGGGNDVGHALIFLCALGAVVAGGWLCWQAAARHIMPPRLAGRVVDLASAVLLAGLALTAALMFFQSPGVL
jgi:hypothetical protein